MYQIAICDDEPIFLQHTKELVLQILHKHTIPCDIHTFSKAEALLNEMKSKKYDLLLLDIMLDNNNGIQIARSLRASRINTPLIFITSSMDYVLEGYTVESLGYLMKPLDKRLLEEALLRAYRKVYQQSVILNSASGTTRFYAEELIYAEINDKLLSLHMQDGHVLETTLSLSALLEQLPSGKFIQCHRSFVVSLHSVVSIWRYGIKLTTQNVIPVSRTFYKDVQQALLLRALDE